jgi:hypothetical protein
MLLRRHQVALVALCVFVAACAPANERPLRGAVPGSQPPAPPGVPPTLTASEALRQRALPSVGPIQAQPSPSPGLTLAASPAPSPQASPTAVVAAAPPIVRTIVPGANGHVPGGGPVTLSAVLIGRGADLASASLLVNGTDAGAQIDKRSPRDWTIHTSQALASGTHTVRVLVRDASGAAGGFTWQITVGDQAPTLTPSPP